MGTAVEIMLPEDQLAWDIITKLGIQEYVIEAQNNLFRIDIKAQNRVLSTLVAANVQIHSLNPVSQTLEDVYIHTTRPDAELSSMR